MAQGSKKNRNDANREVSTRDLRKLKRSELLEIMLAQSEEIDSLRKQLDEKDRQLHARAITIEESGSIAEAALKLTSVFQEAQAAADLYLDNVKARATGADPNAGATQAPDAAAPQASEAAAEKPLAAAAETAETSEGQSANASVGSDRSRPAPESQPSDQEKPGKPSKANRMDSAAQPSGVTDSTTQPSVATGAVSEGATAGARTVHAAHADHSFIAQETAIIDPITLDNIDARLDAADGADAASTGESPRSQAAGRSSQATDAGQADDGVHYEPGQGLKSIEELIDDLKVNGAKHRG